MENPLWVERYRPRSIKDCVLPKNLKATFQAMVGKGEVQNLSLVGRAGVGKTTVARAMLDEIGADHMILNGSLYGNIDTLRTTVMDFASGVSFSGGRKYVILDEADYLNQQSTQPALRNFIEQYSKNCGFILTANFQHRLIEPLWSRCPIVEFKFPREEKPALAAEFFQRACEILEAEKVEFDQAAVAELVKSFFPDFRRALNEMQRYSATGRIDSGVLARFGDGELRKLVNEMRDKNFTAVRKWVADNADEPAVLFRRLYDACSVHFTPESVPQLVLLLAEYQDKSSRVADQEINTAAFLVHVMSTCTFTE